MSSGGVTWRACPDDCQCQLLVLWYQCQLLVLWYQCQLLVLWY